MPTGQVAYGDVRTQQGMRDRETKREAASADGLLPGGRLVPRDLSARLLGKRPV